MISKKISKTRNIAGCCLFLFLLVLLSCASPAGKQDDKPETKEKEKQQPVSVPAGYEMEFRNSIGKQNLMISCIVLSSLADFDARTLLTSRDAFLDAASDVQSINWDNPDIDSFVNANKTKIDFWSDSVNHAIRDYANSLEMHDMIFSEIEDETMIEEMEAVRKKLFQVEGLKKIYLLYFGTNRDLSSLSSTEGVALTLHFAYYLHTKPMTERKAILKKVL